MNRQSRVYLRILFIIIAFYLFNVGTFSQVLDEKLSEKASRIHDEAVVIDAHAHYRFYRDGKYENMNMGEKTETSEMDFITMKKGGMDAAFFSVPLLDRPPNSKSVKENIMDGVDMIRRQVDKYNTLAELAFTHEDIIRIHESGKRAVLLSIEGRDALEGQISTIEFYYNLGVRCITVGHSRIDPLADSKTDDAGYSKLSAFGKEVVREMNRLGMLIDVTHTADNLQLDIIKESKSPVIATHSCVRALHDIPRNIPNHIIQELAKNDGGIMITFYPGHLSKDFPAKPVPIDILIDHIEHAVKVAGIDHVGLGSDFTGSDNHPIGLETAEGFPLITYHLLKRGYQPEEIQKILGGNLLRIFKNAQENCAIH